MIVLRQAEPVARKDYSCDAWYWLDQGWPLDYLSFAEKREVVKARKNGFMIKKGQKYLYQANVAYGEFYTFRAIPAIHEICLKHDLYPDD